MRTTSRTAAYYRGYALALTTDKALRTGAGVTLWDLDGDQSTLVTEESETGELLAGLSAGGCQVVDLVRAAGVAHSRCSLVAIDSALETTSEWLS